MTRTFHSKDERQLLTRLRSGNYGAFEQLYHQSPFPYTFYYGYTNGWLGYLMSDEEIPFGGYETAVTPFKPGAGSDLIDAVLGYIEGSMIGF